MSRPCSSVPRRYPGVPGGESRSTSTDLSGSQGLISGAAAAAPPAMATITRPARAWRSRMNRSEEHTSELQSPCNLVCRLLLEKKKIEEVQRHSGGGKHVQGAIGV